MTRYNSFERFTISSKPVTADYVHAGIFVPVFSTTEDNEQFTFSPLSNAATKLSYWDEEAYVSELAVSSGSPKMALISGESQVPSASDLAAAAAAGEGLVEPGKEPEAKAKKRKADANAAGKQKKVLHSPLPSNTHIILTNLRPCQHICNSGAIAMPSSTESSLATPQSKQVPPRIERTKIDPRTRKPALPPGHTQIPPKTAATSAPANSKRPPKPTSTSALVSSTGTTCRTRTSSPKPKPRWQKPVLQPTPRAKTPRNTATAPRNAGLRSGPPRKSRCQ